MPTRLFDEEGRRLFFNQEERREFIKTAERSSGPARTFCGLLHYTDCTLTEAMTVTPLQIDFLGRAVILNGTPLRRNNVNRTVPVPDTFLSLLDEMHGLRRAQSSLEAIRPI